MKIPEEYKWAYEKAELSKDRPTLFTGAAFMRLIERIATLTEQLEQANSHLNWLPSDQSFICSGCAAVYPSPHATDCPEVQQ